MTRSVLTLALAICFSPDMSAQQQVKSSDPETKALKESCDIYLAIKDGEVPTSEWNTQQAASVAFCKGFFRGYMSGAADLFTKPDAEGHVIHFRISSGTTYDQAIRAFTVVLAEKPELLAENAGVVAMSAMTASGLAVYDVAHERYVRKIDH